MIRPGITSPLAEFFVAMEDSGEPKAMPFLVAGWTYPSEKWWSSSQLGWWHSQLHGKIKKKVPNIRKVLIDVRSSHLQNNCEEATAVKLPEGVIHLDQNPSILFDVFQHLRGQTMVEPHEKLAPVRTSSCNLWIGYELSSVPLCARF